MAKKGKSKGKGKKNKPFDVSRVSSECILIVGEATKGKTTSLNFLAEPEKAVYVNTDLKRLPIKDRFLKHLFTNDVDEAIEFIEYVCTLKKVNLILLDTITHLMRAFVKDKITKPNAGWDGWAANSVYYQSIIESLKKSKADSIVLAHIEPVLDEDNVVVGNRIPVQGSPGKTGVESEFSVILQAEYFTLKEIKKFPKNDNLTITKDDKLRGGKYVFVTGKCKKLPLTLARGPLGFWKPNEVIIDNDVQLVLDRLRNY